MNTQFLSPVEQASGLAATEQWHSIPRSRDISDSSPYNRTGFGRRPALFPGSCVCRSRVMPNFPIQLHNTYSQQAFSIIQHFAKHVHFSHRCASWYRGSCHHSSQHCHCLVPSEWTWPTGRRNSLCLWKGRSTEMFVVQWQTYFRPAKTLGGVPDTPSISRDEMSRQHPVHSVQIQNTVSSFLAVLTAAPGTALHDWSSIGITLRRRNCSAIS